MGWAKFHEDNVSRYWADAKSSDRFPKISAKEPTAPVKREEVAVKKISLSAARPLPVIVLADASGSMSQGGKIETLNRALQEMVRVFASQDDLRADLQVTVVTFSGKHAEVSMPLQSASSLQWNDLKAIGKTPMGDAFRLTADLFEDRGSIPGTAYTPTIVLASDGQPTDDWRPSLNRLLSLPRARKAQRLSLAIGEDANMEVLEAFTGDASTPVLRAADVPQILQFFRFVTMSVCARVASADTGRIVSHPNVSLDQFQDF